MKNHSIPGKSWNRVKSGNWDPETCWVLFLSGRIVFALYVCMCTTETTVMSIINDPSGDFVGFGSWVSDLLFGAFCGFWLCDDDRSTLLLSLPFRKYFWTVFTNCWSDYMLTNTIIVDCKKSTKMSDRQKLIHLFFSWRRASFPQFF